MEITARLSAQGSEPLTLICQAAFLNNEISMFWKSENVFLSPVSVAHASLFIQNISVTICSIVLMLVFLYKQRIEQIWDGWLTVSKYYVYGYYLNFILWHHVATQIESWPWLVYRVTAGVVPSVSLLFLPLSLWLLCAVIVTCCIAKLTQGGLLYGGDHPGRCGKPCKHSADHCHSEGLDCGYNRLQPRSPSW